MGKDEDGGYRSEIPEDAFAEALQSVEKIEREKDAPGLESGGEEDGEEEAVVQVEIEDQDAQPASGPEVEKLRTDLEKARREATEIHEKMLRVAADADNIRKRALKERDEAIRFGLEGLLRELLPVVDNLERTLAHVPPKGEDKALDALREGVEMVLRQFLTTLDNHNVKPIESLGQPFDPKLHEALSREETDTAEPGTVLSEAHRGYMLADRLLRPALVTVACAAAAPEGEAGAGCAEEGQTDSQGTDEQPEEQRPDAGQGGDEDDSEAGSTA